MNTRKNVHGRTSFHIGGTKCLCPEYDETTAQTQGRKDERLIKGGFHLPVRVNKKIQMQKLVKELNESPLGRLTTAMDTTPELRPEKVEQGRKILQCSDSELNERLILAVDRVLDELSYTG
jgi:hypothetical protein